MTLYESGLKEKEKFFKQAKEAIKQLFSKEWYRQIPNMLTASRGIAPAVVLPMLLIGNIKGAIIAEALFASTDFFDGQIARRFHLYSDFGKDLDTICDKIFAVNLLLPILFLHPIVAANIGLEIGIGTINTISLFKGNTPKSSILGKIKTFVLSSSIIAAYLSTFVNIPYTLLACTFGATITSQALAAYDYYQKDKKQTLEKESNQIIEKDSIDLTPKEVKKVLGNNQEQITYNNQFPIEKEISKRKSLHL